METATTFEPGDVAQLKSGGPLMTITGLGVDGRYYNVVWADDNGHLQRGALQGEMMTKVLKRPTQL